MGRRRRHDLYLPKRMYERRGKFYFDSPITKKWEPLGDDLGQALAKYGQLIGPAWSGRNVGDTIDRYKTQITPLKKSAQTRKDEARMLERLKGVFGEMLQDNVTHQHLYRYLDSRCDDRPKFRHLNRPAPVAAFHEVMLLGLVFSKGIRWGVAGTNPVTSLTFDDAELARYKPKRNRYVTDAEFEGVRQLANPRMQLAMELARNIGQRRGDLLRLRREDLSAEGILIRQGKTGAAVLVEWTDELRSIVDRLQALPPHIPRDYLIRKRNGRPYTADGFTAIWQRLVTKALKAGAITERLTFHDLRAKAATDSAQAEDAQKLLGHTNLQTTKRHYIRRQKPTRARPVR